MGLHPLIANRLMHVHTWGMHTKCWCCGGGWLRFGALAWARQTRNLNKEIQHLDVSSRYQHALSASSH